MNLTNYKTIHSSEKFGSESFGIKIEVAGSNLPNLEFKDMDQSIYSVIYDAAEKIENAIRSLVIKNSPEHQKEAQQDKKAILALFDEPIFVEEIPNGYCKRYCCSHLPWFIVTTKIGRIKIGWRNSVINIDWSDSVSKLNGEEAFKDEDATKGKSIIHAWGYEKAKDYINKILNANN